MPSEMIVMTVKSDRRLANVHFGLINSHLIHLSTEINSARVWVSLMLVFTFSWNDL